MNELDVLRIAAGIMLAMFGWVFLYLVLIGMWYAAGWLWEGLLELLRHLHNKIIRWLS